MKIEALLRDTIDGLNELSDKNLQKKLWIEGGEFGISSFTEAICSVFDDSGLYRAIESGELPEPYLSKFIELGILIKKIPENTTPEEIMAHSEMKSVQEASLELLQLLHSKEGESSIIS